MPGPLTVSLAVTSELVVRTSAQKVHPQINLLQGEAFQRGMRAAREARVEIFSLHGPMSVLLLLDASAARPAKADSRAAMGGDGGASDKAGVISLDPAHSRARAVPKAPWRRTDDGTRHRHRKCWRNRRSKRRAKRDRDRRQDLQTACCDRSLRRSVRPSGDGRTHRAPSAAWRKIKPFS